MLQDCLLRVNFDTKLSFINNNNIIPTHKKIAGLTHGMKHVSIFCTLPKGNCQKRRMVRPVALVDPPCPSQRSVWPLYSSFFWWFLLISIQSSVTFNALLLRWFFNVFSLWNCSCFPLFSDLFITARPPLIPVTEILHHSHLIYLFQTFNFSLPPDIRPKIQHMVSQLAESCLLVTREEVLRLCVSFIIEAIFTLF